MTAKNMEVKYIVNNKKVHILYKPNISSSNHSGTLCTFVQEMALSHVQFEYIFLNLLYVQLKFEIRKYCRKLKINTNPLIAGMVKL